MAKIDQVSPNPNLVVFGRVVLERNLVVLIWVNSGQNFVELVPDWNFGAYGQVGQDQNLAKYCQPNRFRPKLNNDYIRPQQKFGRIQPNSTKSIDRGRTPTN